MSKEYLYIGHYIDVNDKYVLKVGTTDNPKRRQKQHNRYYPNADILSTAGIGCMSIMTWLYTAKKH